MLEADRRHACIPCFIITDAVGLRKYGLGMVRMGTRNLAPYLADGYLTEGARVADLATKLGMDRLQSRAIHRRHQLPPRNPASTRSSVAAPPPIIATTATRRMAAPIRHSGPITTAPYYAVRLYPGDIGAATGLVIDRWARVLDRNDQPIGRLYACGDEAQSIMGGTYPGPGITIGPAITFAYRAIQHAVRRWRRGTA